MKYIVKNLTLHNEVREVEILDLVPNGINHNYIINLKYNNERYTGTLINGEYIHLREQDLSYSMWLKLLESNDSLLRFKPLTKEQIKILVTFKRLKLQLKKANTNTEQLRLKYKLNRLLPKVQQIKNETVF